ncbi:HTH-type transcriptional repressor YtrA [Pelotomaculum schinkii]|uniref:HTH-type transcriptional repressor YtrA n=1 Tax=Pelotomaculum schinkii TaxID=78350 RepID=A0A4Y7R649_9FIRM|nr:MULTISPECIES: GntR family transcriptional regulator [Pelotomaculum]TEB04189.1 HTH-type transcriptional repressor YtrA [Pelotomaculum schinkii]TEB17785.1 HTH-type transcriptional repressor YtrA [Pelotomaculum sp. FP]
MSQTFNNTQPIYLQIMRRLCRQVVRGELKAGAKLPSVREMALQTGVNPNTIQRVYTELERLSIAETRRGLGSYITEDTFRLKQLREDLKCEQIGSFIADMRETGFSPEEIVDGVRKELSNPKA